ncbi:MAG: 6-bladed beta-propeller [Agriterribacter sp.]
MKFIITIFLVATCTLVYPQSSTKFYIDPSKTYGGAASDYFDSIEYIPLETTKVSLFGTPTFLVVTDNSIVVGDADTYNILFFELSGKFIKKEHLLRNMAFLVESDLHTNNIIVNLFPMGLSGDGEVRTYTSTGRLIKTEKKYFEHANIKFVTSLDSGYYAQQEFKFIPLSKVLSNKPIPLVSIYNKSNDLIREFLTVNPGDYPFLFAFKGGVTMSPSADKRSAFFVIPYDYGLYRLTKDSVYKIGEFIFPAQNVVPMSILGSHDIKKLDSTGRALTLSIELIESVKNINYHGSKLLFTLQKKLTIRPEATEDLIYDPLNFLYDTLSGKAIVFEKIYPDSLSYNLPIMDGFSSIAGMNYRVGNVYSSISSLKLFQAKEKTKEKKSQYPLVLQKYFQTQDRKSNPVIVRMKLKDF